MTPTSRTVVSHTFPPTIDELAHADGGLTDPGGEVYLAMLSAMAVRAR